MKNKTIQQDILSLAIMNSINAQTEKLIVSEPLPNKLNTSFGTYSSQKFEEVDSILDVNKLLELKKLIDASKPEFIYILSKEHYIELQEKEMAGTITLEDREILITYVQLHKADLAVFANAVSKNDKPVKLLYEDYKRSTSLQLQPMQFLPIKI
jgi:hypothetical protein